MARPRKFPAAAPRRAAAGIAVHKLTAGVAGIVVIDTERAPSSRKRASSECCSTGVRAPVSATLCIVDE